MDQAPDQPGTDDTDRVETPNGPDPSAASEQTGPGQIAPGQAGPVQAGPGQRRSDDRAEYPRKVRGGIKLSLAVWPPVGPPEGSQAAADLAEALAASVDHDPKLLHEALEDYARRGQARRFDTATGRVEALIQGRRFRAYTTAIDFEPVTHERWDALARELSGTPGIAARLQAGEMPDELILLARRTGIELVPRTGGWFNASCTCPEQGRPCKHAAATLMLTAQAIENDPSLAFTLRGMPIPDLLERVRQHRAVATSSSGLAAAYDPQPPAEAERAALPLETDAASFWNAGPELDDIEMPVRKPEVSHPLLRRLGPSPFAEGKFPLVGLLATCYDLISDAAVRSATQDDRDPLDDAELQSADERTASDDTPADDAGGDAGHDADADPGDDAPPPPPVPRAAPKAKAIPKAKAKRKNA